MAGENPNYIVFFDGVCSLCNGFVRFLFRRDRQEQLYVAPLEGKTASEMLPSDYRGEAVDSIVFLDRSGSEPVYYEKSDAVLRILPKLGGIWTFAGYVQWIPGELRNLIYDFIASHRYQWFGKYDSCPTPNPGWKERFLE